MNRKNLQKLATFLAHGNLPKDVRFHMSQYTNGSEYTATCGTAGCAVGFAPFAGIAKDIDEDFDEYSARTLIDIACERNNWSWCFSGFWFEVDNTPIGAAKRIQYLLDGNPIPKDVATAMIDKDICKLYQDIEVIK